jgi:hypothetical protein
MLVVATTNFLLSALSKLSSLPSEEGFPHEESNRIRAEKMEKRESLSIWQKYDLLALFKMIPNNYSG